MGRIDRRSGCEPMATGYSTLDGAKQAQAASKTKYAVLASLAAVFVAVVCVLAVVGTSDYTSSAGGFEELAAKGKKAAAKVKPVKYGDTVTLMNVYNNYMVVSLNGRTFTAGYLGKNDQIKIVSPTGKKGGIKYGDVVALVGQNTRYFPVRSPPSSPAALLRSPRPRSSRSAAARVPSMSVDVSPSRPCSDSSLPLPVVFVVTPPSSPRSKSTPLVSPARRLVTRRAPASPMA